MRALMIAGLLATMAAAPAAAEEYICVETERTAEVGRVTVMLKVSDTGAILDQAVTWHLRNHEGRIAQDAFYEHPTLELGYRMVDPVEGRLNKTAISAVVGVLVPSQPRPTAQSAQVVFSAAGGPSARRPWREYAASRDDPQGSNGFGNQIIFSRSNGEVSALLDAISDGRKQATIEVIGDDGSVMGRGEYRLDTEAFDTAFTRVFKLAKIATAAPSRRCSPVENMRRSR